MAEITSWHTGGHMIEAHLTIATFSPKSAEDYDYVSAGKVGFVSCPQIGETINLRGNGDIRRLRVIEVHHQPLILEPEPVAGTFNLTEPRIHIVGELVE